jgi:hypothetical protein
VKTENWTIILDPSVTWGKVCPVLKKRAKVDRIVNI